MLFQRFFLTFISFLGFISFAQDEMPSSVDEVITWKFNIECVSDNEIIVEMVVEQRDHWHIYAQKQPDGGVSLPTTFTWEKSTNYELVGPTKEYGAKDVVNDGFPERSFPGEEAKFKQKIKILTDKPFKLKLGYEFMACKVACFPPDYREVTFDIKPGDCASSGTTEEEAVEESINEEIASESVHGLDSTIAFLAGSCEGFGYTDEFKPAIIKVFKAQRTDKKDFSLVTVVELDSIFAMYSFNNPNGLKSTFLLEESTQIASKEPIDLTIKKVVGETDTIGYKYELTIKQDISLTDTTTMPIINGELDLFLMGCDHDFHNTESVPISYDLSQALDNKTRTEKDSMWLIFILAFAGGLLALLTPCVFPMIPMTVTFFTKQSKTKAEGIRKALLYSTFIIVIYVILGVLVSSIAGEDALNAMATNPWVNIVFFVLFVVFAISFFGAFEITLPNSWVNKADKQADRGGLIGIFFMAFTLALVSFSCTGPIVGTVLVQSAQGGISGPIVAMLGFSSALALPFGLFAAFPGWLNSMPQSGGWLNTVKVTLGFAEIAFALKFLSNADLVKQWHLLEREVFLAIWIGVFLMLFIYLIGKIRFPHDSPVEKLSVGRGMLAMLTLSFVIYLIPGIWGAPLNLISGFPPPKHYSEAPYGFFGEAPEVEEGWPPSTKVHGHGINVITDYFEALEYAKKVDKPLLIDFTGWACVNCRRMEENVWAAEEIAPIMAEKFIIASLYVDDRGDLPVQYKGKKMGNGREMKTIGDLWMDLEISRYQEVTQPMYVVVDHNENNISGKANYQTHSETEDFKDWLEFALQQYEETKNATVIKPDFEIYK